MTQDERDELFFGVRPDTILDDITEAVFDIGKQTDS